MRRRRRESEIFFITVSGKSGSVFGRSGRNLSLFSDFPIMPRLSCHMLSWLGMGTAIALQAALRLVLGTSAVQIARSLQ